MKRSLALLAVLALIGLGAAISYQLAARERHYRELLARGDLALRDAQTFGAIEAYSGAIALRGDSMLPYLRRGETYQRRGELEAAARDFTAAVTLDPTATRYDEISFMEVINRDLRVMDLTAITFCKDNNLPIRVFDLMIPGNIPRALSGEQIGTLVR